jgi:hypothetical protein
MMLRVRLVIAAVSGEIIPADVAAVDWESVARLLLKTTVCASGHAETSERMAC